MSLLVVWLTLSLLVIGSSAEEFIINGGFEDGDFTGWSLGGNQQSTGVSSAISSLTPHSGNYFAELGAEAFDATLTQFVQQVVEGKSYLLSFWLASGSDVTPSDFSMKAQFAGESVITTVYSATNLPQSDWVQHTAVITAPPGRGTTTLTITIAAADDNDILGLDHVSMTNIGAFGDPQFIGLRGQSYQIHAVDGMIYNLVSSATTQVNARFTFLNSGACPVVEGVKAVNCWSHAGSYLGAIGVQQTVSSGATHQLEINSGDAQHGFESTVLNGKQMAVGDSFTDDVFSVSVVSTHSVSIKTEEFSFVLDNSDRFINQAVSPRIPLSHINAHGLFGQTSQRKEYKNTIKYIEGEVDEYVIAEGSLFGTDFAYNRFNATL